MVVLNNLHNITPPFPWLCINNIIQQYYGNGRLKTNWSDFITKTFARSTDDLVNIKIGAKLQTTNIHIKVLT